MHVVQITPGAGGMYCGNCFRDNAFVAEMRKRGHQIHMVPLYLPMTLDEPSQAGQTPIFFGGINVYLEQISPLLGRLPGAVRQWLSSPRLLKWAAGRAARTQAKDLGEMTLSMLRGEEGNQARELEELLGWLKGEAKVDVVVLSNAMLLGLARRLKRELGARVVCTLQGEDSFLDALPATHKERCWATLAERAREVDLFVAPSRYFAEVMGGRLKVPAERVAVVHNGVDLAGYLPNPVPPSPPVLGYFTRMCLEKGVDRVVEAYILLRQRGKIPNLRLHVGGGMGPSDAPLVERLKARLDSLGLLKDVLFFPNVTREQKLAFFRDLSVLSVPAVYGEAFGLYLAEAWAAGVPVVQPAIAAFPELIEASGAGVLAPSAEPADLAATIEALLLDEPRRLQLAANARQAAETRFNAEAMTGGMINAFESAAVELESILPKE